MKKNSTNEDKLAAKVVLLRKKIEEFVPTNRMDLLSLDLYENSLF
jgi:hypothetical protein